MTLILTLTLTLAQGTLRPDLIESASKLVSTNAECIKTHHNDTQLVRQLRDEGRILEPLKDYHKDEASVPLMIHPCQILITSPNPSRTVTRTRCGISHSLDELLMKP